jgi:hypothetical protein
MSAAQPTPTAARPHLLGVLAGLFMAAGLVLSAMLFTRTWLKIADSDSIAVTGSARRNITSDFIVWRATFNVTAPTLLEAQQRLKDDRAKVAAFFAAGGITNHTFTPVVINELDGHETLKSGGSETSSTRIVGYKLEQKVEIRSPDVDRVMQLDRDSAALLEQGVQLAPAAPEFIYTKAGDAKVEMLAEATKDARARADQISVQGGRTIRGLRSAKMGVFQITPLYSSETSWEGRNDTTSREKTITAVINAAFTMK